MAVAESAFVLRDQATPRMREMRAEAVKTRMALRDTGNALDRIGRPEQGNRIDRMGAKIESLGGKAERAGDRVERSAMRMGDSLEKQGARINTTLDRIDEHLRMTGATNARPKVELDGSAQVMAELVAIRREFAALDRQSATMRIRTVTSGGGGPIPGGGMMRGGGGRGGFINPRNLALIAGALPLVQGLVGGLGGLTSSLGAGAIGGGAASVAGGGALAVGLGATLAIVKPLAESTKEATKAQQQYNKAVQEYGAASAEARQAKRQMDTAFKAAPPGTRQMIREARELGAAWKDATRAGQAAYTGLASNSMRTFRQRALPAYSGAANTVARANAREGANLTDTFTGPEALKALGTYARIYSDNLDEGAHILENVFFTLERIGRASEPFFHDGMVFLDRWTGGWRKSTADIEGTRRTIGGYVEDLKSWVGLTGSFFRLVGDVANQGRPAGRSMVQDLTDTFDRWDEFVRNDPGAVTRWFDRTADATRDVADGVVDIVKGVDHLATELQPLLSTFTQLASVAGSIAGTLGPGALGAGFLGYRALRRQAGASGAGVLMGGGSGRGGAGGRGSGTGGAGPVIVGGGGGAGAAAAAPMIVGGGGGAYRVVGGRGVRGNAMSLGDRLALRARSLSPNAVSRAAASDMLAARGMTSNAAMASRAGRVGGAAGRFAVPGLLLGGVTGVMGHDGANDVTGTLPRGINAVKNFGQGALSTFGLANPVLGTDERTQKGQSRAQTFAAKLPGAQSGMAMTADQASAAYRQLQVEIGKADQKYVDVVATSNGKKNDAAEAEAYALALKGQAQQYRAIQRDAAAAEKEAALFKRASRNDRSREKGRDLTESFGKAFDIGSKKLGVSKAFEDVTNDAYRKMRGMRPAGARILAQNMLAWGREVAKHNPEVSGQVDKLQHDIERSFSRTGQRVKVVNGEIMTGSAAQWATIREKVATPAEQMRQRVSDAFTDIQQKAVGQLQAMGYSRSEATTLVKNAESGKGATGAAARQIASGGSGAPYSRATLDSAMGKRASGGRINGVGLQDTVMVAPNTLAAPGEMIVNRHQERSIDRKLAAFGTSLEGEVKGDPTPHYAPVKNGKRDSHEVFHRHTEQCRHACGGRVYARGGRIVSIPGQPGERIDASILPQVLSLINKYKLRITDGLGGSPPHAPNSDHLWGGAIDAVPGPGGSWDLVDKLAAWAEPSQGHPAHGFRWVGYNGDSGHGRGNHIHLSWPRGGGVDLKGATAAGSGAVAGSGGGSVSLTPKAIRGGGIAGLLGNRATQSYAKGLERKINAMSLMGGGGAGGDAGMGKYGGGGSLDSWLRQALQITGHFSPANLRGLRVMAMGESGGRPNARQQIRDVNSTNGSGGAMGLLQTIPATFNAYKLPGHNDIFNPVDNAIASIRYQFAKYGRIVGHAGYARGGRVQAFAGGGRTPGLDGAPFLGGKGVPWFGKGGSMTAKRPTMIGVGDTPGRSEDVRITPQALGPKRSRRRGRGGAGGGLSVTINHMTVQHSAKGDMARTVRVELGKAIAELADELDLGVEENEDALMGG